MSCWTDTGVRPQHILLACLLLHRATSALAQGPPPPTLPPPPASPLGDFHSRMMSNPSAASIAMMVAA